MHLTVAGYRNDPPVLLPPVVSLLPPGLPSPGPFLSYAVFVFIFFLNFRFCAVR